ncbi:MAG: Aminoglycoside N(6')-acetyltransferase type 1 [Chlamydiales bacterium]|nr:Aminoglycoside N(6')-acetyltransferase type 1 [Chlamydiales bacterium]MCH9635248.1 Aminoglycoside N(6')-acetyltransferase type 1 [Chlamydiales bacterium]MCH9703454.1 acetyltransferase [Chlamydiota bacterium]
MIDFRPFQHADLPLFYEWAKRPHVKDVWFQPQFEPPEAIERKIGADGSVWPFIITLNEQPIGYIQCCDLGLYQRTAKEPTGHFLNESKGSFCIDLFIGEKEYLGKGHGTDIIKKFSQWLFKEKSVKRILIDPSSQNRRAIACYKKAGFSIIREADGDTILELKNS